MCDLAMQFSEGRWWWGKTLGLQGDSGAVVDSGGGLVRRFLISVDTEISSQKISCPYTSPKTVNHHIFYNSPLTIRFYC
jgi:hypothetical protein